MNEDNLCTRCNYAGICEFDEVAKAMSLCIECYLREEEEIA